MIIIDPTTALVCLTLLGVVVVLLNTLSYPFGHHSQRWTPKTRCKLLIGLVINCEYNYWFISITDICIKKYGFASSLTRVIICDAWRYCYFTSAHIAMVSLLVMTLEKVINLKYPLRHIYMITKLRVNITLLLLWIFFIVFDMIPFFPINETDKDKCHYVVKKKWAIGMNLITMATPLPVIMICYVYIVVIVCRQAFSMQRQCQQKARKKSLINNFKLVAETKATKKVSYIIGAYIICWLPSTVYYLLVWLCPSCFPSYYQPHKTWIRFFFKLLVMFNGIVTPLLYCWQSNIFRSNVNKLVKKYKQSTHDTFTGGTKIIKESMELPPCKK